MLPLAAERLVTPTVNEDSPTGVHVVADHHRLKQVLLNLLSNSVKYNRSGGAVTVSWTEDRDWTAWRFATPASASLPT